MSLRNAAVGLLALLAGGSGRAAPTAPAPAALFDAAGFASTVEPFLRQHCERCHGGEKVKGDFRLRDALGHDFRDAATAEHWRGGSFRLYEHKGAKTPLLVHVVEWDSPEAANTYFFLYQGALKQKWKKLEVASSKLTELRGSGDSGRFWLQLDGNTVRAVEGLR